MTSALPTQNMTEVANLLAGRFIQRRDPFAAQNRDGSYMPVRDSGGFTRAVLEAHLTGVQTAGHYLLDANDQCKLFVLDIDLAPDSKDPSVPAGWLPTIELPLAPTEEEVNAWQYSFVPVQSLRSIWHDRSNIPARAYIKRQMRQLSAIFTSHIYNYFNLDTAAAYSGNKGLHIYGFVGSAPASNAREYGEMLVSIPGWLAVLKGNSFFADSRTRTPDTYHNFTFEVYPKQASLQGKDLGNLVRLPLGRNMHNPADPTFFIDLAAPLGVLRPIDPLLALAPGNAWIKNPETLAHSN